MIRRLSTACLSAAVAFVAPTRGVIPFNTLSYPLVNGWVPARDGLGAPLLPSLPSNNNSRRKLWLLSSSVGSGTEESLPQDLGEKFEIYLPPQYLGVMTEPPPPDGTTQPRGTVHRLGYWHRSVHIWLYNSKGEVVMQRRSAGKDVFPDTWDASVGGHISAGDSSLQTAIKETREELGIDCDEKSLKFVCTVATSASGTAAAFGDFICKEYKDIYLLPYDGSVSELQYSPSEVDDVKLIPVNQLLAIYQAQDPTYLPKPGYYLEALVKAIEEALG